MADPQFVRAGGFNAFKASNGLCVIRNGGYIVIGTDLELMADHAARGGHRGTFFGGNEMDALREFFVTGADTR